MPPVNDPRVKEITSPVSFDDDAVRYNYVAAIRQIYPL
jgi:hypothetical protein